MEASLNKLLLILPLFLFSFTSFAEDDNYVEPAYEEPNGPERWEAGSSGRKFLEYTTEERSRLNIPETGSREDYIRWAQSLMLAKKKEALAKAARGQPSGIRGVKCIPYYRAFGFKSRDGQDISTGKDFSVYCDAGKDEIRPTHSVYNNIKVEESFPGCTSIDSINSFFNDPNTWSADGAERFLKHLRITGCAFLARSQNHLQGQAPRKAQPISQDRAKLYDPSRGGSVHTRERKTKNPLGKLSRPKPSPHPRTFEGEEEPVTIPAR